MVAPLLPGAGAPDLLPIQTPKVISGLKARHQASRAPLDVPVFQHTGSPDAPGRGAALSMRRNSWIDPVENG